MHTATRLAANGKPNDKPNGTPLAFLAECFYHSHIRDSRRLPVSQAVSESPKLCDFSGATLWTPHLPPLRRLLLLPHLPPLPPLLLLLLPRGRDLVAYCVHGHQVSQGAMQQLRDAGFNAVYLEGGVEHWQHDGLPLMGNAAELKLPAAPATPSRWITRERPKIDRIACPWLIRRFIDPLAISLGLSVNFPDDYAMLEQGMTVYDALYAWIKPARAEVHNANRFKKT